MPISVADFPVTFTPLEGKQSGLILPVNVMGFFSFKMAISLPNFPLLYAECVVIFSTAKSTSNELFTLKSFSPRRTLMSVGSKLKEECISQLVQTRFTYFKELKFYSVEIQLVAVRMCRSVITDPPQKFSSSRSSAATHGH